MNRRSNVLTIGLALSALAWGIARIAAPDGTKPTPAVATPATEQPCPEMELLDVPTDLVAARRRLLPVDTEHLAAQVIYSAEPRSLIVQSGGWIDDLFESFDDLHSVDLPVGLSAEATVYQGSFLSQHVSIVEWTIDGVQPPCDSRSLVAIGLTESEFEKLAVSNAHS